MIKLPIKFNPKIILLLGLSVASVLVPSLPVYLGGMSAIIQQNDNSLINYVSPTPESWGCTHLEKKI